MSRFSTGGRDQVGVMHPAYYECNCGFSLEWPVTEGLAAAEDPQQAGMRLLISEHKASCAFHASVRAEGPSTAQPVADPVSEVAALPQPPAAADDQVLDALLSPGSASSPLQRLGNGHLLCHTCKKASMETDSTAMADFEARHRHHDKEDLRAPRFFAKAEPATASPSAFAAKALTELQVAAFNRFSAGAHRFDRELAVVRTLDRTGQLDAGLVHLEAAWSELEREYFELHAHIARFVAREYYSRDHLAAAVLPQNAEAAS